MPEVWRRRPGGAGRRVGGPTLSASLGMTPSRSCGRAIPMCRSWRTLA